MLTPYATNRGIRIHYQVAGAGPPLVLQHTFTLSLESWDDMGYVQVLQHDYQLILIAARGHGASDKPHDPEAYTLPQLAGDTVAVLEDLHLATTDFFGYSLEGWIGFGLAQYAPERFHALIIGGAHPYVRSLQRQRQALQQGIAQGKEAYIAAREAQFGPLHPQRKAQELANDMEALLALAQDRPSLQAVLPTMTMPCLLFAGEADPMYPAIRECVQQLPQGTFFSLPDLSHGQAMERSDLVVPHLMKFLSTVPR